MSRRREISSRQIAPDPQYGSTLVEKFINTMMWKGEKSIARNILYQSLDILQEQVKGADPMKLLQTVIGNIKPMVEVKSRRVGGATYQVPVEIRKSRQEALAIRWLITIARQRGEKSMIEKLAAEMVDAYNKRGATIKKREDTHKMAEANKAFAHFRW